MPRRRPPRRRPARGVAVAALLALGLSGCSPEPRLRATLARILPAGLEATLTETCRDPSGAAVGYFTLTPARAAGPPAGEALAPGWTRVHAPEAATGLTARIRRGCHCLAGLSKDAETVLFQLRGGLYYLSPDGRVASVLFDAQPGLGLVFLAAPERPFLRF